MADSWEGVLILLAVTGIGLAADYARRRLPPPSDAVTYVPPVGPIEVPNVGPVTPAGQPTEQDYLDQIRAPREPEEDVESQWDEGGGQEDEGA